jgi:hypothetical protein
MTCVKIALPSGGVAIACSRGKAHHGRHLCDGCDRPVASADRVSPRDGLDFCPECILQAFTHWKSTRTSHDPVPADRALRREAFRQWAREFPDVFLSFVHLSKAARKAMEKP